MKYNERCILDEVSEYIESTYNGPYVSGTEKSASDYSLEPEKLQVNDLIMSLGHGEGAFISNAIEYLARYGKKDGRNIEDLLKAIHNIVLLINLNHVQTDEHNEYDKTDGYGDYSDSDYSDSDYSDSDCDHSDYGDFEEYDTDSDEQQPEERPAAAKHAEYYSDLDVNPRFHRRSPAMFGYTR